MSKNIIISVAAYVLVLLVLVVLYFMARNTAKKMGKNILSFPGKTNWGMIIVICVALVFITVLMFRDFGIMNIILAACSVLAVYSISKDGFYQKYCGLYEKGIICSGFAVAFDDIILFPVFQLPAEEQQHYAKNILIVVTKSKGKITLTFTSEEQCSQITQKLIEMNVIHIDNNN